MTALDEYKTIFAKLQEVQAENERLRNVLVDLLTIIEEWDEGLEEVQRARAVLSASDE